MMTGRPNGAERIVGLFGDNRIDRGDDCAGGAQCRRTRSRRHHRVGIDPDMAGSGDRAEDALDMPTRMNPSEILEPGFRRLAPLQSRKVRSVERRQHGAQPRRRFRMVPAGVVLETGWMSVQKCGHRE
jgi:hypothetical protein